MDGAADERSHDPRDTSTGTASPITFWSLLTDTAATHPDRIVVADDHGRSLTTEQLRTAAERVAAALPVGPGSVVTWQLPTVLESVVLLCALARVGAVQNPVIGLLREPDVRHITGQIGTDLYIGPTTWGGFDFAEMARSIGGFEVLALDLESGPGSGNGAGNDPLDRLRLPMVDGAVSASGLLPDPPVEADAVRWIYYSSGTTAAPKGARHTDASVIASARGMTDHLGIGEGDRYPIAWPFTHIGGVTMLSACLRGGGSLVLFDRFDPATIGERMAAHDPTILGSALPFFRAYLDAQSRHGSAPLFPHLTRITAGGAPTPVEIVNELRAAFGVRGVVQAYGLTEFPIATSAAPDDASDLLLESVGRAPEGVSIRIVDGEVRLRGPQCFVGYVDSALDADAFDEDGWFRTGDLGHLDAAGNLFITGRSKDVIIRNAENISALEIEDVLLRHPAIVDAAVIGLPDARTGERVVAVVALRDESVDGALLDLLVAHCLTEGLARQKVPAEVHVVDVVPRNPMGKARKAELRDWLRRI